MDRLEDERNSLQRVLQSQPSFLQELRGYLQTCTPNFEEAAILTRMIDEGFQSVRNLSDEAALVITLVRGGLRQQPGGAMAESQLAWIRGKYPNARKPIDSSALLYVTKARMGELSVKALAVALGRPVEECERILGGLPDVESVIAAEFDQY